MLDTIELHIRKVPAVSVHRCEVGKRLFQDWLRALSVGNLDNIYTTMKAYFFHKNGADRRTPCHICKFIGKEG